MPIFSTYNELRTWGREDRARGMLKEACASATKSHHTVFLSRSSKDDDLGPGAILILTNHGAVVYADHQDPSIAGADCLAIANHLREVIHASKKFVMLATPRSKDNKWMPCELGLGDGARNPSNVALFPSAEMPRKWRGQSKSILAFINGSCGDASKVRRSLDGWSGIIDAMSPSHSATGSAARCGMPVVNRAT